MEFSERIHDTYNRYQLYLDDGNEPIHLPYSQPYHYQGLIHASALFDCPLRAFKERSKAQAVLPELLKRNNPTLMHRMLQGTRMAEPFQEAFHWDHNHYSMVHSEETVVDKLLSLQGRMDLMVEDHNFVKHVVEFKHRLPQWKTPFPQPRIGDVFQLLAYMLMTSADEGHLVIINTPQYRDFFDPLKGFEVWNLVWNNEYQGYLLISEHGEQWNHPQNEYEFINQNILREEVERQLSYMQEDAPTTPPIRLGEEGDWQCMSVRRKPKNGVSGSLHAMCPYFCHSDNPKPDYEYIPGENGFYVLMGENEW